MVLIIYIYTLLLLINFVCLYIINKNEKGRLDRAPLNDKIHKITVDFNNIFRERVLTIIDFSLIILFAIIIYLIYVYDTAYSLFLNVFLPRIVFLYYVRLLTIYVTEVPSSMSLSDRTSLSPITVDHVFSSHTLCFLSCLIFIQQFYSIPTSILIVLTIIYMFLIVSTREHYSVDVILGCIITLCMFQNYIKLV